MLNTTLCYIESAGSYLMLYRNKKQHDPNGGKWIGVGGKFRENEGPVDCVKREVREETGLELAEPKLRGIVTFVSDIYETEQMCLFTADRFAGTLADNCDEGELRWIPKAETPTLNIWEGDRIFLELLAENAPFFLLKLEYEGDRLVRHTVEKSAPVC